MSKQNTYGGHGGEAKERASSPAKRSPAPLHARLRQTLRLLWLRSPERSAALKKAWVSRGRYQCASCRDVFGPKQVQVDHVVACGQLLSTADLSVFADRLFNGDQVVLCKPCHHEKTQSERKRP